LQNALLIAEHAVVDVDGADIDERCASHCAEGSIDAPKDGSVDTRGATGDLASNTAEPNGDAEDAVANVDLVHPLHSPRTPNTLARTLQRPDALTPLAHGGPMGHPPKACQNPPNHSGSPPNRVLLPAILAQAYPACSLRQRS
jgi:hypothetical protein